MTPRLSTFGGLKEGDVYIERTADAELLAALKRCEYTYVLSSRQTGKTSLMLRTQRKLLALRHRCVKLDLGSLGSDVYPEAWYRSIATEIADALALSDVFVESRFARDHSLTPVHRFLRFLRDVLAESEQPLVLFIDEIEGFQKFPTSLTDDFLAALRTLYNDRDRQPLFRRFAVCLLGVCTPNDLIRDERRTPFNVARGIVLEDFTEQETLRGFLPALAFPDAEAILSRIHHHTSGHPFLTHRLVYEADEQANAGSLITPAWVDQTVQSLFISGFGRSHENLLEVERRLCLGPPHRARQRVALYQSLRRGHAVFVRSRDPLQLELRLTGLVREKPSATLPGESMLVVRNRIFATLFDEHWTPKNDAGKFDPAVWLRERVQHWIDLDRHDAAVLRGAELHEAQRWAQLQPALHPTAECFLAASERTDQSDRTSRLYALLWTLLWSSFTNFLLAPLLIAYWREQGYGDGQWLTYGYSLPFVLSLPVALLADRLHVSPFHLLLSGLSAITVSLVTLCVDLHVHHRSLAIAAVCLLVAGQALHRPQAAILVGLLYPRTDRRLDLSFLVYYLVVNLGAVLGPEVGGLAFARHGWAGSIGTALVGSMLSLYAVFGARRNLVRLVLPIRTESSENDPSRRTSLVPSVLLLAVAVLIFWSAFDRLNESLFLVLHVPTSPPGFLAVLRSLSQEALTSLFVLLLAPLLLLLGLLARRFYREPPAHLKIVVGMLLLAGVLALVASRQNFLTPCAVYGLLSVAELLVVPASLSLTTALAPPGRLSTLMAGCFLLMGVGAWATRLLTSYPLLPIALAAAVTAILISLQPNAWPSFFSHRHIVNDSVPPTA